MNFACYNDPCSKCHTSRLNSFCLKCNECICQNDFCKSQHMGHIVVSFHNICKIIATQQRIKDESKVKVLVTNLRSKICAMIDAYIADIDKSVNEIDQDLSSMLEIFNNANVSQDAYNAIVKTVWENSAKEVQEILENVLMLGKAKKEKFESECINLIRCMPFPKSLVMKQVSEKPKSKSL